MLLEYDAVALHPKRETLKWLTSADLQASGLDVTQSGDSLVVSGTEEVIDRLAALLDEKCGPQHLLWALVPIATGGVRRIRGEAYEKHMQHLQSSSGRSTRLNALPTELGPRYWASMTQAAYARAD